MFFANKGNHVFRIIQIQIKEQIGQEVSNIVTGLLEKMQEEELKIFIGRERYRQRSEKQIRLYRKLNFNSFKKNLSL